jgi:Zn-dependent protease
VPKPQPSGGMFEVSWRILGVPFRMNLTFFLYSLLFGWMMYRGERRWEASWYWILLLWTGCTIVSVLFHEFGHFVVGRLLGGRGEIEIASMGGRAYGKYDELSPWKQLLIGLAGPVAGLLFLAGVVLVHNRFWRTFIDFFFEWSWLKTDWCLLDTYAPEYLLNPWVWMVAKNLVIVGFFNNVYNLLPIITLDGGMALAAVCKMFSAKRGEWVAHGLSFVLAGLLTLAGIYELWKPDPANADNIRIGAIFTIMMFGQMTLSNLVALFKRQRPERSDDQDDEDDRPRDRRRD